MKVRSYPLLCYMGLLSLFGSSCHQGNQTNSTNEPKQPSKEDTTQQTQKPAEQQTGDTAYVTYDADSFSYTVPLDPNLKHPEFDSIVNSVQTRFLVHKDLDLCNPKSGDIITCETYTDTIKTLYNRQNGALYRNIIAIYSLVRTYRCIKNHLVLVGTERRNGKICPRIPNLPKIDWFATREYYPKDARMVLDSFYTPIISNTYSEGITNINSSLTSRLRFSSPCLSSGGGFTIRIIDQEKQTIYFQGKKREFIKGCTIKSYICINHVLTLTKIEHKVGPAGCF